MSEVLYLDKSEKSRKAQESLKDYDTIITYLIEDPKIVDFTLPILFSAFGSFSFEKMDDYKILKDFYKTRSKTKDSTELSF